MPVFSLDTQTDTTAIFRRSKPQRKADTALRVQLPGSRWAPASRWRITASLRFIACWGSCRTHPTRIGNLCLRHEVASQPIRFEYSMKAKRALSLPSVAKQVPPGSDRSLKRGAPKSVAFTVQDWTDLHSYFIYELYCSKYFERSAHLIDIGNYLCNDVSRIGETP